MDIKTNRYGPIDRTFERKPSEVTSYKSSEQPKEPPIRELPAIDKAKSTEFRDNLIAYAMQHPNRLVRLVPEAHETIGRLKIKLMSLDLPSTIQIVSTKDSIGVRYNGKV